jgi:tRNA/rRNA methyltransferase
MAGTDHSREAIAGGPAIVLVEPQLGENIGTAARAMANFGLSDLRLVSPRDGWPSSMAVKAASGADWVIDGARVFGSVAEAVADLTLVYATTARTRDMVKPVVTPEEAAAAMRERLGSGRGAGVLFGRERTGLTNDDVAFADAILMAPVNPAFASLNLAQAVLLVGYEWFKTGPLSYGDEAVGGGALTETGMRMPGTWPATKEDVLGFFEHLERELDASGFLRPPEKRPAMVRNLRNLFQRCGLTEQDVRTLRGVVASLVRQHERGKGGGGE